MAQERQGYNGGDTYSSSDYGSIYDLRRHAFCYQVTEALVIKGEIILKESNRWCCRKWKPLKGKTHEAIIVVLVVASFAACCGSKVRNRK